jgi:hypothetical protein
MSRLFTAQIAGYLVLLPLIAVQSLKSQALDIARYGARCNGSDDASAVQSAIDALSDGGMLVFSCQAGVGASGISLSNKNNITVKGINGGGLKALAAPPSVILFHVQGCKGCTIEGLVIDGNNVGVAPLAVDYGRDTKVQNNTIVNVAYPAQAGLVAMGNRRNKYIGNTIRNTGIQYDSSGNIVDASRGIWVGNQSDEQYEWYPYIANNKLRNIGGTAIVAHAYSATITGNVGTGLTWSGAKLVSPSKASGTSTLEGNSFSGKGGTKYSGGGIQIGSEQGNNETVVIQNNTLEGEVESGVYIAGPFKGQIIGNTMRNNIQAGITITASANDVTISDNQIYATRRATFHQAIRLVADHGSRIRNVRIIHNAIRGFSENGILIQANGGIVDDVAIADNSIMDNGWYALFIDEKASQDSIRHITWGQNCLARNVRGQIRDNRGVPRALIESPSSGTCGPTHMNVHVQR